MSVVIEIDYIQDRFKIEIDYIQDRCKIEIDYIQDRCKISIFFSEFPALGFIAEASNELNVLKQGISGTDR